MPSGSRQLLSANHLHFVAYRLGWSLDIHIENIDTSNGHNMPQNMSLSKASKWVLQRVGVDNGPDRLRMCMFKRRMQGICVDNQMLQIGCLEF